MKYLLFSSLFLLGSFKSMHHANLAIFDFIELEGEINVSMKLDEEHLEQAIRNEFSTDATDEVIANYILSNLSFTLNRTPKSLCVDFVYDEDGFIIIEGSLGDICEPIALVEVSNTCLIDIEDHSNIMKFKFNDSQRVFRLTAKRTSTIIKY